MEGVSCFPFDYTICNFTINLFFYECMPSVNSIMFTDQSSEADDSFQEWHRN